MHYRLSAGKAAGKEFPIPHEKLLGKSLRIKVLELLALCGSDGLHAYGIAEKLDVTHGSLYPALARIVAAGEVTVVVDEALRHGQTSKRYVISQDGLRSAQAANGVKPQRIGIKGGAATTPRARSSAARRDRPVTG